MYPLITRWSLTISMTWLGWIISILTFLYIVYYICAKRWLQFSKLFYWIPTPIILSYLLGSYLSFILSQWSILPTSLLDIQTILSPYNFQFHYVWLIIWMAIAVWLFLRTIRSRHEQFQWIDAIAQWFSIALIPLGIFLLMGDHFVGIPHSSWWVTYRGDISQRSSIGKVLPIGVYLSIVWVITIVIHMLLATYKSTIKRGYLTIAIALSGIAAILILQHSPKYGILTRGPIILDIKSYISFLLVMICLQQFFLQFRYHQKRESWT